jgi:hypothetical protein
MFRKRQKLPNERSIQEQTRWEEDDPGVKERITKMYDKHAKRKNAEETATRRAEKRQKRISTREKGLMCPAPEGVMATLRWLSKNKMASN